MTLQIINGPIMEAGESLSEDIDCSAGPIVKITMPGNWVDAVLTFQTSSDGEMYNDVFQPNGQELSFTVVAGTGIVGMRLTTGWVKFRSGTRERPVVQPELREFSVALDVLPSAAPPAGKKR